MNTQDIEKMAEQLHDWYLEATSQPDAVYNYKAVVPYADLSDGQKAIDRYIAQKVTTAIKEAYEAGRKDERDRPITKEQAEHICNTLCKQC